MTVTAEPLRGDRVEAGADDLGEDDDFALADPGRGRGLARVRARHGRGADRPPASRSRRPAARSPATSRRARASRSSAALEAALCLALLGVAGAPEPDRVELAKLCSRVENDWVGAETGLLDQLASLLGEEGHALRIDFRTLDDRAGAAGPRRLEARHADSGAAHSHAGAGYNERREECRAACEALGVESLRDADPDFAAPRRPRCAAACATC